MTEIVLEQRIAAPPSAVYRYLTASEKWELWQGVEARVDAREGGRFSVLMVNGAMARGEFVELIPNERVVFTWGFVDRPGIPPGSTLVEIDLEAVGEETRLVLTHRSVPADEAQLQRLGWTHYVPRLATAATGVVPVRDPGPG